MADIATRSTQNIHGGGVGYKPTNTKPTARYTVTKTITKTSATLATITMVITIKTNSEFVAVGLGETLTYQLVVDGVQRGSVVLKTSTQTMNASGTYSRTLVARNVPLDHRTTQPANLRLVNNKRSDWTFNSNTQGGDQIVGLPIGIQQSNFSKFERFDVKNGTSTFNFSLSARSSGVTHTLRLKHGTTTIATWTGQGNLTSRTLTQAQSRTLLNRMSDVLSATVSLEVDTVYGGTALYTQTLSAIADVDPSEYPDMSAPTITDRTNVFSTIGAFVQGQSTFRMSINGVAIGYGTTLDYYSYEWNGQTYTSQSSTMDFGPINSSGEFRFRARVRAKRPASRSRWSEYITVLPWSAPRSTSVKVQRCKSNGTIDPAGSYIRVTGSHSVSPLKVGTANKNTMRVLVRYRVAGTTTWTNALNKTYPAGTVSTSEGHTVGSGALDPTKTYEFEVIAYDRYANTKVTGLIPTERVLISKVRNDGVGFGKIRERGIIDARGDVYIDGDLDVTDGYRVNGNTAIDDTGKFYIRDTRSVNTPTDNGVGFDVEFKSTSTIGLTGVDSYAIVHTFQGWRDASGGNIHQLAFTATSRGSKTGKIFYRTTPTGNASWGSWVELPTGLSGGGSSGDADVTVFSSKVNGSLYDAMAEAYSAGAFPDGKSFQMMFHNAGSMYSFQGMSDGEGRVYGFLLSGSAYRIVTRVSTGLWRIADITSVPY